MLVFSPILSLSCLIICAERWDPLVLPTCHHALRSFIRIPPHHPLFLAVGAIYTIVKFMVNIRMVRHWYLSIAISAIWDVPQKRMYHNAHTPKYSSLNVGYVCVHPLVDPIISSNLAIFEPWFSAEWNQFSEYYWWLKSGRIFWPTISVSLPC